MGLNNLTTGGTGGLRPPGLKNLSEISAIPDSGLLHHYDWTEASGSTTVVDQEGDEDLTGSYTGPTATINGLQAGEFDGVDDLIDVDFTTTKTQPLEIFHVLEPIDDGSQAQYSDGFLNVVNNRIEWPGNGDRYFEFAGSSITGGTPDQSPQIVINRFDGTNSEIVKDGTQIASGDVGTNDLDGFTVGARRNDAGAGLWYQGAIGEIPIYDPTASGYSRSDVLSYLADKWGISI